MSDPDRNGRPPLAPRIDSTAEFLQGLTEAQREQYQQIQEQQLQQNTEEGVIVRELLEQIPQVPPSLECLTPQERLRLVVGTYFLTMEEILHNGNLESIALHQLRGSNVPKNVLLRDRQIPNFNLLKDYNTTITHHNDDALDISSRQSTSHGSRDLNSFYPRDIFGRPAASHMEVAHLIPQGKENSYEWMDVSNWALGFEFNCKHVGHWRLSLRLLRGVQTTKHGNRKALTGLVHSRYNRLRLEGQRYALDGNTPYVMFLPIMTIQQCLDWRGESYSAIVLVAAGGEGGGFESIGLTKIAQLHAVRRGIPQELQTALTLLRNCAIGMAQSLQEQGPADVPENTPDVQAINSARDERGVRRKTFQGIPNINVPRVGATIDPDQRNRGILKIEFGSSYTQAGENENLHPAPDPLLLVARSSVVWSVRNNWRLRASAEPQKDDDSDSDLFPFDENLLLPSWLTMSEKESSEVVPEYVFTLEV